MEETKSQDTGDETANYWDVRIKELSLHTATASLDVNTKDIKNIQYNYPNERRGIVLKSNSAEDIQRFNTQLENFKGPSGLILDSTKVSTSKKIHPEQAEEILGCGTTSKVVVVKDVKLGVKSAQKTIMLAQFDKDQINAWIHLEEKGMAPKLYSYQLEPPEIVMRMEILEGKTLKDISNSPALKDPDVAVTLAFCALEGMLSAYEALKEGKFTHGDLKAENVILDPEIKIKYFDFDKARSFLNGSFGETSKRIKNDLLEIIRMFCCLYTDNDLADRYSAERILQDKSLNELSQMIRTDLNEDHRKELFYVLLKLMECVSDPMQEHYGDTTEVSQYIKNFSNESIKKKLAVILFPERFQDTNDHGYMLESETFFTTVWDDPALDEFAGKVTMEDLINLIN